MTLGFTGITITDALDMGALKDVDDLYVKALLAGNELLIVTDYEEAYIFCRTKMCICIISISREML